MSLSPAAIAYCQQLISQLQATPFSQRRSLIEQAMRHLDVSYAQVYRELNRLGYRAARKVRTDKGTSKVEDADALLVANLMAQSTRQNGKRLLTFKKAKALATANGVEIPVSTGRLAQVMKDIGIHPKQLSQPRPSQELQSLHPNYLWEIDASTCVVFYLNKGGMQVLDERKFNDKKPKNIKSIADYRITRYIAVDHYSGAFHVEYFLGAESSSNFFNFLLNTCSQRQQVPFHGVPFNLYFDAAAAHQAYLIQDFLDWLQINNQHHLPNNAQATGAVETLHNIVERNFEGVLYMVNIEALEQLNQYVWQWEQVYNGDPQHVHSRHGHTRYAFWQTIRHEQLRVCPPAEVCRLALRTKPEQRQVQPNLQIEYQGATYCVKHIAEIRVGEDIQVCTNPYQPDVVNVKWVSREGQVTFYQCPRIEFNQAGFRTDAPVWGMEYQAKPDTQTDKVRKEMRKQAYGTDSIIEADKRRNHKVTAFTGQIDPFADVKQANLPDYLNRQGTELTVEPRHVEIKPLTHPQALKALRKKLGRNLTVAENAFVKTEYPEGVLETEINTLVARLTARGNLKLINT